MVVALSFLVSSLVERSIGDFSEELNVLCFLFADDDGTFEVNVNDDDELVVARLEEEMFDVTEEDVCNLEAESARALQSLKSKGSSPSFCSDLTED